MHAIKRFRTILLWSVISAAFIGPGTLATATAAGSQFGFELIWALVFATIACLVLQEMAARISIVSKQDLGFNMLQGFKKPMLVYFVALSVILGCVAYQAGNILGAFAGLNIFISNGHKFYILIIGLVCFTILYQGSVKRITNILSIVVAIMGLVFLLLACMVPIDFSDFFTGAVVPKIPDGSGWLVLGLVGTTIVPYNLFLGAGVAKGQQLKEMRFGLAISVIFGGFISIAILIVATKAGAQATFEDVAQILGDFLGNWAFYLMGIGLFAAGLTSSITSPLAASIIAKSVFGNRLKSSKIERITWIIVLAVGLFFGMLDIKPLPVIIAAQALNGLVLPLMVMILIILANDKRCVGTKDSNSLAFNVSSFVILYVVLLIGLNNTLKVVEQLVKILLSDELRIVFLNLLALPFLVYTIYKIRKLKLAEH